MAAVTPPALSVGIVLLPDFTMLALSAFVDTLRLAADDDDRSRQVRCRWHVMSDGGRAVRASNGIAVEPTGGFADPGGFDYVAIVGGTMHRGPAVSEATTAYLKAADASGVPLIGLCTGSFILARAGLMHGRKACVSWFHKAELETEFPEMTVVADQLFVFDRDRITCAGGTSVIHLASHLVERHLGPGQSHKGLRVMLEDRARTGASLQPAPMLDGLADVTEPRVRRAMLLIERHQGRPVAPSEIGRAVGLTERQLHRLFVIALGMSPSRFSQQLRLDRAHKMVIGGTGSLTSIAVECGFADASHFSRDYRRRYGMAPIEARRRS